MDKIISTPFGKITVYVNDSLSAYDYSPYVCKVKTVCDNPITASYKISVPCTDAQTVRCVMDLNCENISTEWDTDERYLGIHFYRDDTIVTIGAEADNTEFDTEITECGIQYLLKSPRKILNFTVAWTTDYKGEYDIRTNLATDIF